LGTTYPLALWSACFVLLSWVLRVWWPERAPAVTSTRALGRWGLLVAASALAALVVRARVAEVYRVTSASMLPSLRVDDRVLASKLAGRLRRGDMVVFRSGAGPLVKRVVALAGDRVAMRGSTPVVNGAPVDTCDAGEYLEVVDETGRAVHGRLHVEWSSGHAYLTVYAAGASTSEEYVVPEGAVFVVGDDRALSVDSRSFGAVPVDAVLARVVAPLARHPLAASLEDGVARCVASRPKTGDLVLEFGRSAFATDAWTRAD
jgi:signal peptidase I